MSKYIIDVGDAYIRHGLERTLTIPVRINEHEDHWMDTRIPVTPYTEPDLEQVREEAYENGYKTAKVQCNIQAEKDLREVGERHYQKGLSDAWEAARKIVCRISDGGYTQDLLDGIFGSHNYQSIMALYSASDAVEKISKYEPEQTQIGDEVEGDFGIGTITKPVEGGAYIMWRDGSSGGHTANQFRLTGRHFPEIAAVLEKMRGEQDE